MSKNLYIIGNGFDIHHGLETRYQAFAIYLQKKHADIYDLLIEYFALPHLDAKDKDSLKDPFWADFENALADLDFETVLEDNTNYLASPGSEDFKDSDWHAYQFEMEMIVDKLTKDLRMAFKEFIMAVEFPEAVDNKILGLQPDSVFLNFNYTDTLEKYYHVHRKRILYIHGKAKLPDEGIILGHGRLPEEFRETEPKEPEGLSEEELERWREEMSNQYDYSYESGKTELMSYFNDSFKATSEIIEKRKSFFESLGDSKQIFILGHSIAIVDEPYFTKVIESINDKSIPWIVSYHRDDERDSHLAKLVALGLQESQISLVKMDDLKLRLPSLF